MSLLDLFRRTAPKPARISSVTDWSTKFRVNAYCEGDADWYADSELIELNPDFAKFGPLFQNVCVRMPEQWYLQSITHFARDYHEADYSCHGKGGLRLAFLPFDRGFRFILDSAHEIDEKTVGQFLNDLSTVLNETGGLRGAMWYTDEQFGDACTCSESLEGGSHSPCDLD